MQKLTYGQRSLPPFLFLLLLIGVLQAAAQPGRLVKGQVTDEQAKPLSGVTVRLKTGGASVSTGETGSYAITLPGNEGTLVFSFVGMKTKEVAVTQAGTVNVTLEAEANSLQEVVTIGYGQAKKKDVTGAISTVDGDQLVTKNMTQVSQTLQGTMPGVMVTRSSSEPGATAAIRIRGITTIGTSDPLIIMDGVPVANINDINANDIQNITVLKDAASASIYGARAAAGVILVTTKRARTGQLAMDYNANLTLVKPTKAPEVVGVDRYLRMINEFTWNDAGNAAGGDYALYSKDVVDNWLERNKTNPNQYPVTNWRDMLVNSHALRNAHYIGITAGGEKAKTLASINYENANALYDYRNYERITARVNNSFAINNYLNASIDVSYNRTNDKSPSINPIWDALRYAPIYAATWADGRIAQGQNGSNAYAQLQYGGFNNTFTNKLNARASLEFRPMKDLSITGVFAPYLYNTKGKKFTKQIPYFNADNPTVLSGYIKGNEQTSLSEARNDGRTFTKQLLINYTKSFSGHNLNLLGGYEDFSSFSETLTAGATNYVLSDFPYLDLGPLNYVSNGGNATQTAYRSYFGRMLYDYKNRYLLQANIRYDGSSRFHPDYRWGAFPSVSAGWAISEESFMHNNGIFSYLKLRASWGQLGNERIGNYPYQSSISYSSALFNQGGTVVSGITAAQTAYAIQNISWETTESTDFGVDAYFLNNRLQFTGDYYHKNTKDMLLELEIPDYIGYDNPQQNTGKMNTKGWDIQASWKDKLGALRYTVSVNLSDSRTRMGNLGGIVFDGDQIIRQGSEYNEWYGYKSDGLYQTAADVTASPKLYASVKPGDVKYKDISGPDGKPDGKITPDYDRVLLGGSLPRYQYGGAINLEYKGFDFSFIFQGIGKQNVRVNENMVKPFMSAWTNAPKIIDGNYWSVYNTPEQNLAAKYPRLSNTSAENNNYKMSDYWLISGAYFRVKNIALGYNLPQHLATKAKLKGARIYAAVTDPITFDHMPQGWDPEVSYTSYIAKTFTLGLSVKF